MQIQRPIEQIREQQRDSWNKFSPGWKKWDDLFMDFLKPMGESIIHSLDLKSTDVVLDVASGTGEPGLSIAPRLHGGLVVITDLAEDMLAIARENAMRRMISNIEIQGCDVCDLPFADNTFDAISCRLGFMFFPDMLLATVEMARVLKPGGKIVTSVWGAPEKNFWVTAITGAIQRNMALPVPPVDAPGMFRCAKPDLVASLFREAGLENVSVREITGKLKCGTADVYWNVMTEIAAPVVAALGKADEAMKEKIRREVYETVNRKYPDGNVVIESSALVIYGEK